MEWRHQRTMMVAKGAGGTAAAFFAPLVLAAFKAELHMPVGLFVAAVTGDALVAFCGLYVLVRTRTFGRAYARLLTQLEQFP